MEKDVSQITMREIVEDAGVNISFIHYHFKHKNDLFRSAIVESTDDFFKMWVSENINLVTPSIEDLERYIGGLIETLYIYPTIYRSKIYMFIEGVDLGLISSLVLEDFITIASALIPKLSGEEVKTRAHFLGQIIISLRISITTIKDGVALDFEKKEDRLTYSKLLLKQIFPELYRKAIPR